MFMTKEEILKKVETIEERKVFVKRCLKAKVCPDCGGELKRPAATAEFKIMKYRCNRCNFGA